MGDDPYSALEQLERGNSRLKIVVVLLTIVFVLAGGIGGALGFMEIQRLQGDRKKWMNTAKEAQKKYQALLAEQQSKKSQPSKEEQEALQQLARLQGLLKTLHPGGIEGVLKDYSALNQDVLKELNLLPQPAPPPSANPNPNPAPPPAPGAGS